MSKFINFAMKKIDTTGLHFHYLRVGKAKPLLDRIKENLDEETTFTQHEVKQLAEFHYSATYTEDYNATIINIEIQEDEIANIRRDFWENYVWKTDNDPLPLALIIPNSKDFGSLTTAETSEALSLIRLTDRPFRVFELQEDVELNVMNWLFDVCSIVHRHEKEEDN
ncbi:MAG: hypothetical protein INQ03_16655 [Candidatus Heimdallarchaeota archaeon]|nr:hypothetical protein [Candidatus Heimdallarchaeota archaeon]